MAIDINLWLISVVVDMISIISLSLDHAWTSQSINAMLNKGSFLFSTGLFIFLCFAASGKALDLYRSKLPGIIRDCTRNEDSEGLSHNCDEQSVICRTNEGQDTQDTYLWLTNVGRCCSRKRCQSSNALVQF